MSNMYGGALPSSTSGAANATKYQTNLGRTKTKKWVQASVPNYDGDDWGNDYDDEPEPEPPHPHPAHQQTWPPQQHPNSLAPGLGSRPLLPSESSWTPPDTRNIPGPSPFPSQGQQQAGPATRHGTFPQESNQSWEERRSFTTGAAEAMRVEPSRSPPPLATAPTPTAATGAGPSSVPPAQENATHPVARTASPSTAHFARPTSNPQSPVQQMPSTLFPPRKSSMSRQDGPPNVAAVGPLLQSGSGSGPKPLASPGVSSQKPWMEARPGSPQGPRSPPQTGKPLPFVRPADIYKRLEEDREKERRSQDSGRPSLDSVGAGSGGDNRVGSPGPRPDSAEGASRTSLGKEDAARELSPRGTRPQAGLATVAERTSEYGLEDYFVDPSMVPGDSGSAPDQAKKQEAGASGVAQSDPRLDTENTPRNADTAQAVPASVPAPAAEVTSVAAAAAPVPASVAPKQGSDHATVENPSSLPQSSPAQKSPVADDSDSVAESEKDTIRRFSTSPVLPDFSRMSSFGFDMFGSSFATGEELQPSPLASSGPQPQRPAERATVASPLSQVQQSSPSPAASSASTPAPGPQAAAVVPPPITDADHPAASTRDSTQDASHVAQSVSKDRSDTPPANSALYTAPESRDLAESALQRPADQADGVKSPALPLNDNTPRIPADIQNIDKQAGRAEGLVDSSAHTKPPQVAAEIMQPSETSREASRTSTPRNTAPAFPPPASSRSRSQSPSKVQAMVQAMNQANAKAAGVSQPGGKAAFSNVTSPVTPVAPKETATALPTSPQQTLGDPPVLEPLEPVTRTSTFNTTVTESPVKESDKLREEIILSLSPQQRDGEFTDGRKLGVEAPSSGVPRESTYLGDVYDDYYGGADDIAEEPISEKTESYKAPGTPKDASSSAPMPKSVQELGDIPPLDPASMSPRPLSPRKSQPSVQIPALKHRFSWEVDAEEDGSPNAPKAHPPVPVTTATSATPEPPAKTTEPEPKSLSIVPPVQPPAQPPSSLVGSPLPPAKSISETSPVATGAANIPRQVSEASTLAPGTRFAAIELPSPISVRSDDQSKPISEGQPPRTLAEEKSLMTSSSSPVSPPPEEEHPAFSETPAPAIVSFAEDSGATPTEAPPAVTAPTVTAPEPETTAPTLTETAPSPTVPQTVMEAPPQSPTIAPTSPMAARVAPFREIMSLPTAAERIERLDETREVFSKIDSGLVSWLVVMTQVPENANASWSLRDNITNEMLVGSQKTGPGIQQSGHAPAGTNGGSRPISGLGSGSQFLAADLRHSGKEVGAKGKELLMAGGKAAKGLFSKGKSRFRAFER